MAATFVDADMVDVAVRVGVHVEEHEVTNDFTYEAAFWLNDSECALAAPGRNARDTAIVPAMVPTLCRMDTGPLL